MGEQAPAAVRFCDVGPIMIERDGVLEPVRGRRVTAALAMFLIRANQRVSSDALVDALWGDAPSEGAIDTLDSHVWRLRRLLEPERRRGDPFTTIVHDTAGFRLAVTAEQVDSLLFETLAGDVRDLLLTDQSGRALARCEEALGLWRGEPWAPHNDEAWAVAAVSRLHELRGQVREQRIQALVQLGEVDAALADIEPLLAEAPMRERLWALAMLAAYRAGRADQALETYSRARHTLIEEAGIEPGPELRDLQAQILSRDPDLDGPARQRSPRSNTAEPTELHLPHRRTELLGRADELDQLVAAVANGQLTTVVGPAGCGKTRLVIDVARHAAPDFPDGVWFVDLTAANDTGQLLDVTTSTLGLAAPAVGTATDALRAFTRTRRMLLVLDNCEHILDEVADTVDALFGQHSELTVLATSREPLDLDDEHVHTLGPLPVRINASDDSPRPASGGPAVQLFLQRLAVAAPHLETRPLEFELAAEICTAVDGLPLAIELAAGQARSFSLPEIADRVRTDLTNLSRIGRGGNRHHATLRGAIESSTATLTLTELAMHRAVSVVPGPFTTELAAHLADISPHQAATALAGLVHRSLLTPLGSQHPGGPSRFTQLATIRSHGLGALSTEDRREADERRDRWVGDLVAGLPPAGDASETVWYARIDDDYAAVRATLQHCLVDAPHPTGTAAAARLGYYWFYRGMTIEWQRWTSLASRSRVGEPFDRLIARGSQAGVAGLVGGSELFPMWLDELDTFTAPLSESQQVLVGQYLLTACTIGWLTGDLDLSRRGAGRIRELAVETGDNTVSLFAEVARLLAASQTEDPDVVLPAVQDCYRQAQIVDNFYASWVVAGAGTIACLHGSRPAEGLSWSDVYLVEFTSRGLEVNASVVELRGTLQAMDGKPYDALRTLARARAMARRVGTKWPNFPSTPEVLASAEGQLSPADSERAYREGSLGSASGGHITA